MNEEIKEAIEALPKTNNTISAYGSIDINELYKTIEKFKKVPDYNELMKNNNNLQQKVEQLEKENKELNRMCELYGQSLYNADLTKAEKRIEQLENIRKEAIKYMEQVIHSDSSTKLPSGKITDIGYCIVAFEDLLNILNKGDNENG